ncbi:MAG: response regulator [Holosporales bacterium]|jgi:CheY-like chemotaxis protein/plasmid maintenance system antidote protein VapI|nr:response regulator [Holosporales bacterium]
MIDPNDIRFIEEHIGKQLRAKRKKRGFTLAVIASKIGISHQQVQKYEQAQSRISAAMLYKFSSMYGVGIEKFFEDLKVTENKKNGTASDTIDIIHFNNEVINILIVEDNPADETIARKALEEFRNLNILCVHDGVQAMEVLRYKTLCPDFPKPDLVLMDIFLPKKDGLSVLRDIKRDRDLQCVPVIMLTNNTSRETMVNSYKSGASGYICKSFDYETFKDNLSDCIKYWSNAVVLPTTYSNYTRSS